MFGTIKANQLLSKIAELEATAKDRKGGQMLIGDGESLVPLKFFNELALIVAEQARELEQLKSYVNRRIESLPDPRSDFTS